MNNRLHKGNQGSWLVALSLGALLIVGAPSIAAARPTIRFCGKRIALTATKVRCFSRRVTSLEPLLALKKLRELSLSKGAVRDLKPLWSITTLRVLNLGGIDSAELIAQASRIPGLEELILSEKYCGLRSSDLKGLAGMTSLRRLDLALCHQITDLKPLVGLRLTHLDIGSTGVTSLAPLARMKSLVELEAGGLPERVKGLSAIGRLTRLKKLEIGSSLSDQNLAIVANLRKLEELDIWHARVSDLRPLAGLRNLRRLNLSSTKVADLSPLRGCKKLEQLSLSNTTFRNLEQLQFFPALRELNLVSLELRDLGPLAKLVGLTRLNLEHNPIVDVRPLSSLKELTALYLSNCPLRDLSPLKGLHKLQYIGLSGTGTDEAERNALKKALPHLRM